MWSQHPLMGTVSAASHLRPDTASRWAGLEHNTTALQQPSQGRSNVPTRAYDNDSDHTIARAAFLQAHGSMGCALRWCATRSRRQIACSKATLQIPRSHVPLPISFLANPESFRLPPCRSRRRQNSRKRQHKQLSGPKSGSERRTLLAPNQELKVLISIIFILRRKIGGRGAVGFRKSWDKRGRSSRSPDSVHPTETWDVVT